MEMLYVILYPLSKHYLNDSTRVNDTFVGRAVAHHTLIQQNMPCEESAESTVPLTLHGPTKAISLHMRR